MSVTLPAIPRRSLTLQPLFSPKGGILGTLLAALVFVALYGGNLWLFFPSLIDDVTRGNAPPVSFGTMVDGKCQSRIVSICDINVSYGVGGVEYSKELHYLTFLSEPDDERPLVMYADPSAPEHVTSNWGRDLVVNRIITQLVFAGLMVALVVAAVRENKRRKDEAAARAAVGAKPSAIAVQVTEQKLGKGYTDVHYTFGSAKARIRFPSGVEPYWLSNDGKTALALTDGGAHVVLMDAGLASITNLTADERAAITRGA